MIAPVKVKKPLRQASLKYDRPVVIERVLEGMEQYKLSATKACAAAGVPLTTLENWIREDSELATRYARARENWIDNMAQEIQDIADAPVSYTSQGSVDTGDVQNRKLQIDTRKWLLSKIASKKYGDKVEVDHTGTVKIDAITRKVVDPALPLTFDQKLTERAIKGLKNDSEDEESNDD